MSRITAVDAAFATAAAATGIRGQGLRICGTKAPRARRWTEAENEYLRQNWGRIPEPEVAAALKRTPVAVHIHAERELHLRASSKRDDVLTGEAIAIGIGIDGHSVHKLIDRGLMPGRRIPTRVHAIRLVAKATLMRWLLDPGNWIYFNVNDLGEIRHRGRRGIPAHYDFGFWDEAAAAVKAARRLWDDAWLRPGAVAKMLRLPSRAHYVNAAIRRGTLDAKRWGNWWILGSAIPEGMTLNFRGQWVQAKKRRRR